MDQKSTRKPFSEIVEECPLLTDPDFLKKYPGIGNVASFLHESFETAKNLTNTRHPFYDLGVDDAAGYVSLIDNEHEEAIGIYIKTKCILQF